MRADGNPPFFFSLLHQPFTVLKDRFSLRIYNFFWIFLPPLHPYPTTTTTTTTIPYSLLPQSIHVRSN